MMPSHWPEFSSARHHIPEMALSAREIIEMAGTKITRASVDGGFYQENYIAVPALPVEEQNGIELARLLFSSGEKIRNREYYKAANLVSQCKKFSSQSGNPLQRLAFYISQGLQERIERETGGEVKKPLKANVDIVYNFDDDLEKSEFYGLVALYTRLLPYAKLMHFTSVQAIIDAVGNANNIHVIDLGIRTGCQWTVLIQFLAQRPSSGYSTVQLLKITAVGMNAQDLIDSGKRLHDFAKNLSVPFSYSMVEISNMDEFHQGLLNVKSGEAVAVYAPSVFRNLLHKPPLLHNLVSNIKKIRPKIMVTEEVEAEHNSPCFANRFIEVLFYCSTYFDCLDLIFPDRNDIQRVKIENMFCGDQIKNMIACEGQDRYVRHVGIDTWRCFFRQEKFKEMEFSYQAWYQARLLVKEFPHGDCYTLESNGSAMTIGWKGTPLHSLSAWTCN